jgi:hypothetical protein
VTPLFYPAIARIEMSGSFSDRPDPSDPIPGYVQWARSSSSNREFPVLVFAADVDFVTDGMVSLTSVERNEVVATMAENDEWCDWDPRAIESRINGELSRADLRCVTLLRVEGDRSVYVDLFSEGSEAFDSRRQTLREFRDAGGIVTLHRFGS